MITLLEGDCREVLKTLPAESVQCCVTSPPYFGLRSYLPDSHPDKELEIGAERHMADYIAAMVEVFRQVRRVLRPDAVMFANLGDSYATGAGAVGSRPGGGKQGDRWASGVGAMTNANRLPQAGLKPKDLMMIPARVAIALQADGWYLRSDIIWHKPNPMPESVTDRPTKSHEYVFLLTKAERYFYDAKAIAEPLQTDPKENYPARAKVTGRGNQSYTNAHNGSPSQDKSGGFPPASDLTRNARSVWTIATRPYTGAHFAVMPSELAERCIKAGSRPGDTVLDPFFGAGTTGLVADRLGRQCIGIELHPGNVAQSSARITGDAPLFAEVS